MNKKAQIGQVFKYIMALIVGALILFYGSKMVLDLVSVGKTVEVGNLLKNIEKEVDVYYNYDEGSQSSVRIGFGKGSAKYLCVFDKDKVINSKSCYFKSKGKIGRCALKMLGEDFEVYINGEKPEKNVYLLPMGSTDIQSYDIKHLKPAEERAMICYADGEDMVLTTVRHGVECS